MSSSSESSSSEGEQQDYYSSEEYASDSDEETEFAGVVAGGRKSMMNSFAKKERADIDFSNSKQTADKSKDSSKEFKNKQRVLLLSSRGITYR